MKGIYLIVNTVDGKKYVGQSSDIDHRINRHKNELHSGRHPNSYLQRAWNKYGGEVFRFSVIEATDNLDVQETYWMKKFDTRNRKYGYNICAPNNPYTGHARKVSQICPDTLKTIRIFPSGKEAMLSCTNGQYDKGPLAAAIRHGNKLWGYYWTYANQQFDRKNAKWQGQWKAKSCRRTNITTGEVQKWRSTNQARLDLGVQGKGTITYWCQNRKNHSGWRWEYE